MSSKCEDLQMERDDMPEPKISREQAIHAAAEVYLQWLESDEARRVLANDDT